MRKAIAVLFGALCCACVQPVSRSYAEAPPQIVEQANAIVARLQAHSVGVSAAVAHEGRVIWAGAAGNTDVAGGSPVSTSTRYRIYSVSKPITVIASARLLEAGRLQANTEVRRYVSGLPDHLAVLTPMLLATHRSGIRHYANEAEARNTRHCTSVSDALPIFQNDPLVHEPGEMSYSSWGFVLLSAVVEGASGQTYEQAMQTLVFQPLHLSSFTLDGAGAPDTNYYSESVSGTFESAEVVDNSCKWGAGAWLASAPDVALVGLAMVDDSLLRQGTRDVIMRGQPTYRAQGVGAGGAALLLVNDEHDLSVALLTNTESAALGPEMEAASAQLIELFSHPS